MIDDLEQFRHISSPATRELDALAFATCDDPAGLVRCDGCLKLYHRSWGKLCGDCTGAD